MTQTTVNRENVFQTVCDLIHLDLCHTIQMKKFYPLSPVSIETQIEKPLFIFNFIGSLV